MSHVDLQKFEDFLKVITNTTTIGLWILNMSEVPKQSKREFYLVQRTVKGSTRIALVWGKLENDVELDVIFASSWIEARSKVNHDLFEHKQGYGLTF